MCLAKGNDRWTKGPTVTIRSLLNVRNRKKEVCLILCIKEENAFMVIKPVTFQFLYKKLMIFKF